MRNFAYILCFLIFICSVYLRQPDWNGVNYHNADATMHTLLTVKAMQDTPLSIHKFLPIVSLGDKADKHISWGMTLPDKYGNYYYTSFGPLGFIAPYIFITALNLPVNPMSLYIFNSFLCLITLLVTIKVFLMVFSNKLPASFVILSVTVLYLFGIEVMHSQGPIYWNHSLFQALFIIQVFLFLRIDKFRNKISFFLLSLILPYLEWTGFISNAGFALVFLLKSGFFIRKVPTDKNYLYSFGLQVLVTTLSGVIFIIHFLTNLQWEPFRKVMEARFFARSFTDPVSIIYLLKGYYASYGYFLFISIFCVVLFVIVMAVSCTQQRKVLQNFIKNTYPLLIIFFVPMFENLIMKGHAIGYSFDRLKLVFFLIFVILSGVYAFYLKVGSKYVLSIFFIIFVLTGGYNLKTYLTGNGGGISIR